MFKTKLFAFGLMGVLTLTACSESSDTANSQEPTANSPMSVRIATESNYKPFSYLDNEGNHQGFEIDLIHALCRQMQADCTISSQDWESIIPGLIANKYDAIFASMSATDERQKTVNFSEPYFNNKLVLVGKKGDDTTIDDIAGQNVAAQQATVAAKYLTDEHPQAIVKVYGKQVDAYLDLAAGRVAYLLSDIAPALDWLKTEQGANFELKGQPIDINDNVAIAMRQEGTELADKFNSALAALKSSGEYDNIVNKYFDLNAINGTPSDVAVGNEATTSNQ